MEKVKESRIADLDRKKYLVPGDLTGWPPSIIIHVLSKYECNAT